MTFAAETVKPEPDVALAVRLLRGGASLPEIGEILRHRSPQSTSIYARVDLEALRPLALRWPGGAP